MPKGNRHNLYKRGEVWWARVTVAGKEYRSSLRTRDERIAERRAAEWKERLIAQSHFGENRPRWEEAFVAWSAHIVTHVAPKTAQRYAVSLGQIESHLRGLFLDQIDKRLVSDIVKARRAAGAATATIRRDLSALSNVMTWAQDEYDLEGNAALDRLRKMRERRDPIVLPAAADIERVITRAPGALAHLIRAAWLTGCRQDELVALERRRVDWGRSQMTVIGKGNKLRVVPLSPAALSCLRSVPVHLTSSWLFHHDGEPYRNVASRFAELVRSCQKTAQSFRRFRFHDLRHAFAVDYLKSGGSIYRLQAILGHRSVKTTEIYLAYLTPEEAERSKLGVQNTAQLERFDGSSVVNIAGKSIA